MIHNPDVNADLQSRGVQFIMNTSGDQLIEWDSLTSEDVVIVPAFGTTLEIQQKLSDIGINAYQYDTTCPFVEKVWNRASAIGQKDYTIVVHGKPSHEETRATFSHAKQNAPTIVVKDMKQTVELAKYITGEKPQADFYTEFKGQYSENFDVEKDYFNGNVIVARKANILLDKSYNITENVNGLKIDNKKATNWSLFFINNN